MLFFCIYSIDHTLKNMLMKLRKYFDGNFLFRLFLEQVYVGCVCVCVEEDLHAWFAQSGLTFKGVYDKNTWIFVERLLCIIVATEHTCNHIFSSQELCGGRFHCYSHFVEKNWSAGRSGSWPQPPSCSLVVLGFEPVLFTTALYCFCVLNLFWELFFPWRVNLYVGTRTE